MQKCWKFPYIDSHKPLKNLILGSFDPETPKQNFFKKNLAMSFLKLDGTLISCKKSENLYYQFWRKTLEKLMNGWKVCS